MPIIIKPKKSETASAVPTTGDLAVGEICVNVTDQKIYTRKSNNSIVVVGSHIDAVVGGDVTGTVSNIQIAANAVGANEIAGNAIGITELNVSDGTAGQILKTNGSGTLSFTDSGATIQQATAKAVTMAIALG